MFIQISLGIHYLHTKSGIIHRDLKSLNIFLTKDNSAKIGDLGNCQRLPDKKKESTNLNTDQDLEHIAEVEGIYENAEENDDEEQPPQKVGTPFYLAPELWQDKPCTKKSDIWALGVILYELCTQKFPWQASEMDELQNKVLKEKFDKLPNYVNQDF